MVLASLASLFTSEESIDLFWKYKHRQLHDLTRFHVPLHLFVIFMFYKSLLPKVKATRHKYINKVEVSPFNIYAGSCVALALRCGDGHR